MRPSHRRVLPWLGTVLAFALLFAPGSRDLGAAPADLPARLAAILYPTVGHDALWERPSIRVPSDDEPSRIVEATLASWPPAALLLLVASMRAVYRLRGVRVLGRQIPTIRRRGPPRAA
jgi:hypothetical protein